MSYKVKLDIFEGPFDLLVYLIENAEMSIYDIQVSKITSQYLEYMGKMQAMDVTIGSEFMLLAAALIEIKSKMLLPRIKPEGDGSTFEDPRTELVQRILEYKRFKLAAELLEQQEEQNLRIFAKPKEDLTPYTNETEPYLNLELSEFVKVFNLFLSKKKKVEEIERYYEKVERQKISVESRMEYIKDLFQFKNKHILAFQELLETGNDRYEVVLTFSAMLEMIRQNMVEVKQPVLFGEITLKLHNEGNEDQTKEFSMDLEGGILQ